MTKIKCIDMGELLCLLEEDKIAHSVAISSAMTYINIHINFWGMIATLQLVSMDNELHFEGFTRRHPNELGNLQAKGRPLTPGMCAWVVIKEIINNPDNDLFE